MRSLIASRFSPKTTIRSWNGNFPSTMRSMPIARRSLRSPDPEDPMKWHHSRALSMVLVFLSACVGLSCSEAAARQDHPLDSAKIEEITGLKGAWNKDEGVFKV